MATLHPLCGKIAPGKSNPCTATDAESHLITRHICVPSEEEWVIEVHRL